ncbi:hypothetical protein OROHE_007967 [Orobanche hederae]
MVLDRGEKIELLVDRTENLQFQLPETRKATTSADVVAKPSHEADGWRRYSYPDRPYLVDNGEFNIFVLVDSGLLVIVACGLETHYCILYELKFSTHGASTTSGNGGLRFA